MFRVTAVIVTILTAAPAYADWQYTHWGMTADQAIAASNGSLSSCTPAACKGATGGKFQPKTIGEYQSGEFKFENIMLFDDAGGLAKVRLKLADPAQITRLQSALVSKYGEFVIENAGFLHTRRWMTATDRIELQNIGTDKRALVLLEYSPRATASNKGL
jgi:hypothetical protein